MKWKEEIKAFWKAHSTKIVIGIVGTGLVLLLLAKLDTISDYISSLGGGDNGRPGSDPDGPSFSPAEYADMANVIFGAMNRFGTDEQKIYAEMAKLGNATDLQLLTNAFGKRAGDSYLGEGFEGNMVAWFKHELTENEQRPIKAIYERFNTEF